VSEEPTQEQVEVVDKLVDEINAHIEFIHKQHRGMSITLQEVMANTIYWGRVMTKFYPEFVDLTSAMMAKFDISGEAIQPGETNTKLN